MENNFNFDEFLMALSLSDSIQSYFDSNISFKIFFIDTINAKILLKIFDDLFWFSEIDFISDKLCR